MRRTACGVAGVNWVFGGNNWRYLGSFSTFGDLTTTLNQDVTGRDLGLGLCSLLDFVLGGFSLGLIVSKGGFSESIGTGEVVHYEGARHDG